MPITRNEFDQRLRNLGNEIFSSTDLVYVIENQTAETITVSGENRTVDTVINIGELYNTYLNAERLNTTIIRAYITGYKYSQAYALLLATGLYYKVGRVAIRNAD
jgi:hypothetical protein